MSAPILNQPLEIRITPKRRDLFFRSIDGQQDLLGTMSILHHYKHCDEILEWLIAHNYTGKKLANLLVKKFKSSVPNLVLFVVDRVNKHSEKLNAERSIQK